MHSDVSAPVREANHAKCNFARMGMTKCNLVTRNVWEEVESGLGFSLRGRGDAARTPRELPAAWRRSYDVQGDFACSGMMPAILVVKRELLRSLRDEHSSRGNSALRRATLLATRRSPRHAPAVRRAIYPGSFDPLTFGHLDVLQRAASLFDEVVIAVAINDRKASLFTIAERQALIARELAALPKVRVATFQGLLVEFARAEGACAVVRGLRAVSDFEFEFQMALMNRKLDPAIETIFLTPREEFTYLSSRIVKEIARLGGNVEAFVPPSVVEALRDKLAAPSASERVAL